MTITGPIEVRNYRDENGNEPLRDWLDHLKDLRGQAKIRARIRRLEKGNPGDHRNLDDGLLELKIDSGPGYRVYAGRHGNRIILLLCGGDKSTQSRDIARAKQYWSDYLETEDC